MPNNILSTLIVAAVLTAGCGNSSYVNMFMGTKGDHGQVTPAACVPFGLVSVCPDTNPLQHAGYDYDSLRVLGVSLTRISGTGGSGIGGNIRILPASKGDFVEIVRKSEKAVPGYYETEFSNGSACFLTATRDMAVEKYILSKDKTLYLDFNSSIDPRPHSCHYDILSDTHISGWFKSPTVAARGSYKLYFDLSTSEPFKAEELSGTEAQLSFDTPEVEVRVALSGVDGDRALAAASKWSGKSFKKLKNAAMALWREKLDRIDVKGGTEEQKRLFYTSLMRIYHSPMWATSDDGYFTGTDGQVHKAEGFTYYAGWSIWDTFRAKFPMLVVLEPVVMRDICRSLVELYSNGKLNWATPYESTPTVRTEHAGITLLDAYRKGITDIDFERGYEGMKKEEREDLPMAKPDQKLESAYDIWALAQIAGITGRKDDEARYSAKADSLFEAVWTKEFMTVTPDFTVMRRNGLYQGSRYQYRWMAPEYLDRMIELEGAEKLEEELEYFFDNHLFNQGNEPDIHTPFIFNRLGHPEKTQEVVRNYLTDEDMIHIYGGNAEYPEPYRGRAFRDALDGYAPEMDEDDGTMSAWYMFCQMGFYPLVVGADSYELVSPYFDEITIKPSGGCGRVTIRAVDRKSYTDPVKKILLNGCKVENWRIDNSLFRNGGTLEFKY